VWMSKSNASRHGCAQIEAESSLAPSSGRASSLRRAESDVLTTPGTEEKPCENGSIWANSSRVSSRVGNTIARVNEGYRIQRGSPQNKAKRHRTKGAIDR
jgi:hypothetical protein